MSNRKVSVGDTIYLLLTPNNHKHYYRYQECTVLQIMTMLSAQRPEEYHKSVNIDELTPEQYKRIKVSIEYTVDSRYCAPRKLDNIYLSNELDKLEEDINNLNDILDFKTKQKQELKEYIDKKKENWNYTGELPK